MKMVTEYSRLEWISQAGEETAFHPSDRNHQQACKGGSMQTFIGPEPSLWVSRQNINNKIKHWVDNKNLARWRDPYSTQRQAWKLISGPSAATKSQLLSFNRTQSRVVTGLLTRYNILWRHLHIMVLSSNPACTKCGTEEETSVHVLCEYEALASLRHTNLGSFFLDPEDVMNLSTGAIWNFGKGTGLL
jgi:hypothetical protein